MNRSIQHSLIAGMAAIAFTAGTAFAAAPERDPGQQSPTSRSNMPAQQSPNQSNTNAMAPPNATTKFYELDVNSDGVIDEPEAGASAALMAEFKKLDTNHDGKLSLSEFSAAKDLASIKIDTAKKKSGY